MTQKSLITVVEFTQADVKVVQGDLRGKELKMSECCVIPMAQRDDQEITRHITTEFTARKPDPERTVLVIPRSLVNLRALDLPAQDDEEIRKMLDLQVIQHTPHIRSDILFDYTVIRRLPLGYTRVLLIIAHRQMVIRYLKILQDAGLSFCRISISSLGIAGWYSLREKIIHPGIVFIDLNALYTEVCLCDRNNLIFSRSLTPVSLSGKQEDTENLIGQIKTTLESFSLENPDMRIDRVVILSESPQATMLTDLLKKDVEFSVEVIRPSKSVTTVNGKAWRALTSGFGVSFASVLGAFANYSIHLPGLMPKEIRDARRSKIRFQQRMLAGSLLAALLLLALTASGIKVYEKSSQLNRLKARVAEAEKEFDAITEVKHRAELLKNEMYGRIRAVAFFSELFTLTPDVVMFDSLSINRNGILTLKGAAATDGDVNRFYSNLTDSSRFKDVILDYSRKQKSRDRDLAQFQISCKVRPDINGRQP